MSKQWYYIGSKRDFLQMVESVYSQYAVHFTFLSSHEYEEKLSSDSQQVIFIEQSIDVDAFAICRKLKESNGNHYVVIISSGVAEEVKQAYGAGADDVLFFNATTMDLYKLFTSIDKSVSTSVTSTVEKDKEGIIWTVTSTKGGVGKSTLSVNIGTALAKMNKKVVVLDISLQFGDVALLLDAIPQKTIYDWVNEAYGRGISIDQYVHQHKNGVYYMIPPLRPELAEMIKGVHIKTLIQQVKKQFDVVVIDTTPMLQEYNLIALEESDDILLVTTMDLPTLKNTKLMIETLEKLDFKGTMHILLNRYHNVEGITKMDIGKLLGRKITYTFPLKDKLVCNAGNVGIPFVISHPNSPLAKSVNTTIVELLRNRGVEVSNKEKKFSFSTMFARKGVSMKG